MCSDETNESPSNEYVEPTDEFAANVNDVSADVESEPKSSWNRRKFLKAAALGAAAATLMGRDGTGRLRIGPSSVLAHTDTKSACTAQDIEVSSGIIINEPCSCTPGGTFEAIAAFQVTNNNNATRKCITLHLGAGGTLGGQDYLLNTKPDGSGTSNISGLGTTQTMYANLGTLPCNFGQECHTGSVVAFQTAQNQSDAACAGPLQKYPGGQCRRQTICIVGFGATLACATDATCTSTGTANCTVACGGKLYLSATASGGTTGSNGTYTFTVTNPNGVTVGSAGPGASSPQCFTISNPTSGTYTLTVKDSNNCTRTATTSVSVASITAHLAVSGNTGCNTGVLTFTGSAAGCSGAATFRFKVDNGNWVNGSGANGDKFTYSPSLLSGGLDTGCHTVTVEATCGGCQDTTSRKITQCVTSTVGAEDTVC